MAGILNKLNKRGKQSTIAGMELVVRSKGTELGPKYSPPTEAYGNTPPQTKIVETNSRLDSPDQLFRELQAESKQLQQHPVSNPQASMVQPARSQAVIKITGDANSRKPLLADESLPWWLTEPAQCSPQVDTLVPAARLALNELLTENMSQNDLIAAIQKAVNVAAEQLSNDIRFSPRDLQEGTQELISFILGKGPLQPLYDDPFVTDIYLDSHSSVKCMRRGQALETPFRFRTPSEYEAYITTKLQSVERVLNLSCPIVDCVLNDQWRSRINAVHASLLDGIEPATVIRVPRLQQVSFYDLLRTKTLPATLAAWLAELVACGEANILVIGPTGSGKTTLTTALLSAVGSDERIITIEDVPEIFVPTAHLEKLVSRPPNAQGEGAVIMADLLRAALRRAPHRIVVGEIRDKEGPLFLKALETGHAGSVATLHADAPKDGLWRLLDVVAAYESAPQESIQRRIARSLHVVISLRKINGRPCLTDISEVRSPINGEFILKQLVKYENEVNGKRYWRIMSAHSTWVDKLRGRGMDLQSDSTLLPMQQNNDGADLR